MPRRLGDVRLRYDTPLLIGETARHRPPAWSSGPLILAVLAFGGAVVSAGGKGSIAPTAAWLALAAVLVALAVAIEGWGRRRRRFILDFSVNVLRLDFTTRIQGAPRTLRVPFDGVRDLALVEAPEGDSILTVDFVMPKGALAREVLIAHSPASEREELERVERLLRDAFGLAPPPTDVSPML